MARLTMTGSGIERLECPHRLTFEDRRRYLTHLARCDRVLPGVNAVAQRMLEERGGAEAPDFEYRHVRAQNPPAAPLLAPAPRPEAPVVVAPHAPCAWCTGSGRFWRTPYTRVQCGACQGTGHAQG